MDGVAPGAELIVLDLQIEALVEIQSRAVFVELGADPATVIEDEIDLLRTRQERAPDRGDRNALGTLLLDPLNLRHQGMWLDRHAKDHLILHDEPRDRLPHGARLRAEQADQERQQVPKTPRGHLTPNPMNGGFAAKR
jgi:hypothetical protein